MKGNFIYQTYTQNGKIHFKKYIGSKIEVLPNKAIGKKEEQSRIKTFYSL